MASLSLFPELPDGARVWIHPTSSPLAPETQTALLDQLDAFIDGWTSHEKDVRGKVDVLYNRFVILAGARSDASDPSGCAIDDATRTIDRAAANVGIEWVPSLHVLYRSPDGTVKAVSRSTFQDRIDDGVVTTATTVFDPSVTTLGAVRTGGFEQPAEDSWHAEAFSLPEPA